MKKNIVAGLGEIGTPILRLISGSSNASSPSVGYDIDPALMNARKFSQLEGVPTMFLHVCIPFNAGFSSNVASLYKKFLPEIIVVHSTVSPYTTKKLQKRVPCPVIYSAVRGVHRQMLFDLKRHTKFYAIERGAPRSKWAVSQYASVLRRCGVRSKMMRDPITLELAKIVVDTTYYGWLINFAQLSNMIAIKHGVDYDEMWSFSDETHKYLGNRPKMFPGFIGGHCVIPNLDLIDEKDFYQIDKINNAYAKKVRNAKTIYKKYVRGGRSRDGGVRGR